MWPLVSDAPCFRGVTGKSLNHVSFLIRCLDPKVCVLFHGIVLQTSKRTFKVRSIVSRIYSCLIPMGFIPIGQHRVHAGDPSDIVA